MQFVFICYHVVYTFNILYGNTSFKKYHFDLVGVENRANLYSRGGSSGGARAPPKIGKNMIFFGVRS